MNNIFDELYIFEMANNHQGKLSHGKAIVNYLKDIKDEFGINAAVKLQYRDLWPEPNFIHPDYRDREDVKHVPRFLSTRLTDTEFIELIDCIKSTGLKAIVTPFDEASVDKCIAHEVDVIKVASCSVKDWPLLEKISGTNKPVIISTGGAVLAEIDNVVNYFIHNHKDFALMHCVGVYPCPNELLDMSWVSRLSKRYPSIPIGYSGHESPENYDVVKVAVSMGAKLLERHVGLEAKDITLNKYSMGPKQVRSWINSAIQTKAIIGQPAEKNVSNTEIESLNTLKRGVFAKKKIKKGEMISSENTFFSMPYVKKEQVDSGYFKEKWNYFTATKNYNINEPICEQPSVANPTLPLIRKILHEVKGFAMEHNVSCNSYSDVELSHHFGLEQFHETGAALITVVNREFAKKILIMLPGQSHPEHMHKLKEEMFEILSGDLTVRLNGGNEIKLRKGDTLLVKRNTWHEFWSEGGVVIEEVSTKAMRDDSYYKNSVIDNMDSLERKTLIDKW